jgi:hypothetical protein
MSELIKFAPPAGLTAYDPAAFQELLTENLGDEGIQERMLSRITIPSQGLTKWIVTGPSGEEMADSLDCVVVFRRNARAYWPPKPAGEAESQNEPPECTSFDGKVGVAAADSTLPGGACKDCPLNQWGSAAKGSGKACKEMKRLYILRGSNMLPEILSLPPTSLLAAEKYLTQLLTSGMIYYQVLTRITLERAKNEAGTAYSEARFTCAGKLGDAPLAAAKMWNQTMKSLVADYTGAVGGAEAK